MRAMFITPPPEKHKMAVMRLRLEKILFLFLLPATSLLMVCGGGSLPPTYTTTVTGTISGAVTASPSGESSRINLPGAMVSALTTLPQPGQNKPTTAGPDGRFTLQVKHPGTFKLKVENACYEPLTTKAFTASADGSHNAGVLKLTLKPEPTGTARYSITPRTAGGFKLTVMNCVRMIETSEFGATGTIITTAATAEGVGEKTRMITEIALPSTLTSIGENGLMGHALISKTLTIPRNVETLAKDAFQNIRFSTAVAVPTVIFEARSKLTTIGDNAFAQSRLKDFTLPENLETIELSAFAFAQFSFSADFSPSSGTLIIPAKVSKIGMQAFMRVSGITAVDIRSDKLAKPATSTMTTAANFPLGDNLFQGVSSGSSGITEIKLPQAVYDSYTKAELQAIFGNTFTNYKKPDGTAYDFAAKS